MITNSVYQVQSAVLYLLLFDREYSAEKEGDDEEVPSPEGGEGGRSKSKKKSRKGSPKIKIFGEGEADQFVETLFQDEQFRTIFPNFVRQYTSNDLTNKSDDEIVDSAYEEIFEAADCNIM